MKPVFTDKDVPADYKGKLIGLAREVCMYMYVCVRTCIYLNYVIAQMFCTGKLNSWV